MRAEDDGDDREDGGEDRPVDEEAGDVHRRTALGGAGGAAASAVGRRRPAAIGSSCGVDHDARAARAAGRATTTRSSAVRPSRTTRRPSMQRPDRDRAVLRLVLVVDDADELLRLVAADRLVGDEERAGTVPLPGEPQAREQAGAERAGRDSAGRRGRRSCRCRGRAGCRRSPCSPRAGSPPRRRGRPGPGSGTSRELGRCPGCGEARVLEVARARRPRSRRRSGRARRSS